MSYYSREQARLRNVRDGVMRLTMTPGISSGRCVYVCDREKERALEGDEGEMGVEEVV